MDLFEYNILSHLNLVKKFKGTFDFDLTNINDFPDFYLNKLTPGLFFVFSFLSMTNNVYFTQISCLSPLEWKEQWADYADQVCFIKSTYIKTPDGPQKIIYYQWMPYFYLALGFMFFIPRIIQKILISYSKLDINFILNPPNYDIKAVVYVSNFINEINSNKKPKPFFTILFFITKLLNFINILIQLLLIQIILKWDHYFYGFNLLSNLLNTTSNQEALSKSFPRLTYCDVTESINNKNILATIQCIVPANIIYEKFTIFGWIWNIIGLTVVIISSCIWLVKLIKCLRGSKEWIIKELTKKIKKLKSSPLDDEEARLIHCFKHCDLCKYAQDRLDNFDDISNFMDQYLSVDVLFLLQIIQKKYGGISMRLLLIRVWFKYIHNKLEDENDDENEDDDNGSVDA